MLPELMVKRLSRVPVYLTKHRIEGEVTWSDGVVDDIALYLQIVGSVHAKSNSQVMVEAAVFDIARLDMGDGDVHKAEGVAGVISRGVAFLSTPVKLNIGDPGKSYN